MVTLLLAATGVVRQPIPVNLPQGERKDENQVRNERRVDPVQRSFTAPMDSDQDPTNAGDDNRVLRLMLPKNPHGPAREISLS